MFFLHNTAPSVPEAVLRDEEVLLISGGIKMLKSRFNFEDFNSKVDLYLMVISKSGFIFNGYIQKWIYI